MSDGNQQSKSGVGSVFDLPAKSFNIVKENWQIFAIVNIFSLIGALFSGLNMGDEDRAGKNLDGFGATGGAVDLGLILGIGAVAVVIAIAVSIIVYALTTNLEVRASRGEKPDFNTLWGDVKKYWLRLIGLGIVIGVIVIVGLILLIVPGVIAIIRLCMAPYLMVEKDLSIEEAIKASNSLAKNNMGAVAAALGLTILIAFGLSLLNVVPVIGQLVGTVLTIAFSLILVLRYQELKGAKPVTPVVSPAAEN